MAASRSAPSTGSSLEIARGEMVALLGKTGCGKSTTFNLIAGLLAPSEGAVRVQGLDPFQNFDDLRGKIAVVFQNDRLLPWRSAIGNVELGLEMLDRPAARAARDRAALARAPRPCRPRERFSARAVGRHAPAREHRARLRDRCQHPAVRRAVLLARRDHRRSACARNSPISCARTARPRCSSPIRSTRRCRSATASSS